MSEFDKIIGYKDVKAELFRLCDVIKNADKYKALGVAPIGGLLLDGEPGVGKTLMANCFIKESGRKAFVCRKNKPDGEFVNEIKNVFNEAAENAPSIILLDDMDKFANEDDYHRNAEEYVTVQSCIDEIKGKDVFVLATTNGTENLPRSLLRAGRFDCIINVDAPGRCGRKRRKIFQLCDFAARGGACRRCRNSRTGERGSCFRSQKYGYGWRFHGLSQSRRLLDFKNTYGKPRDCGFSRESSD